jgi:hypothetical protein
MITEYSKNELNENIEALFTFFYSNYENWHYDNNICQLIDSLVKKIKELYPQYDDKIIKTFSLSIICCFFV